jgi:tetratricopeptide (TPR) repeat protein
LQITAQSGIKALTMSLNDKILAANQALDNGYIDKAAALAQQIEFELTSILDATESRGIRSNLGGLLIDIGTWKNDIAVVRRGTDYAEYVLRETPLEQIWPGQYYNVANGYMELWRQQSREAFKTGDIPVEFRKAKSYYRSAIELVESNPSAVERYLRCQLLVNYANCLSSAARGIEAIDFYDKALALDPLMGQALGNKALELEHFAPLAHGHIHALFLETLRLVTMALNGRLDKPAAQAFVKCRDRISHIVNQHDSMQAEEVAYTPPVSPFHQFLREFCIRHNLYLTPSAFLSDRKHIVHGDPMFISKITAPLADERKFDRYITFLNQIKEDYVSARFFLIQSQFPSNAIDVIDIDVTLYYPLDYSMHGAYLQLLKMSMKLAMDLLDKIAVFVLDYCSVKSLPIHNTYFSNLWFEQNSPDHLRAELAARENPFLYALSDLASDLAKGGSYEVLNQHRNALTHRYLAVHDMVIHTEANMDIPRITVRQLFENCVLAMKVARASVMYLIMFVEVEERKLRRPDEIYGPIFGTPVDQLFRWHPRAT